MLDLRRFHVRHGQRVQEAGTFNWMVNLSSSMQSIQINFLTCLEVFPRWVNNSETELEESPLSH